MQRINYIYPLLLFYFFFCNIFSQETLYSQARRIGESALFQKTPLSEILKKKWDDPNSKDEVIKDYLLFYKTILRSIFSEDGYNVPLYYNALKEIAPIYLLYFNTKDEPEKEDEKDLLVISYLLTGKDHLAEKIIREELASQPANLTFYLLAAGIGVASKEKFFTDQWTFMLEKHRKQTLCIYLFFHAVYTCELRDIRISESEILQNLRNTPSLLQKINPFQIQDWMGHLLRYYMKLDSSHDLSSFRSKIEKDSLYLALARRIPGYVANIGRNSKMEYIIISEQNPKTATKDFLLDIKAGNNSYHSIVPFKNNTIQK